MCFLHPLGVTEHLVASQFVTALLKSSHEQGSSGKAWPWGRVPEEAVTIPRIEDRPCAYANSTLKRRKTLPALS